MRVALSLATIARAFDTHVFQPTYLLPSDSGLRPLLAQQSQDESQKASALRAQFHALLPRRHGSEASRCAHDACRDIMSAIGGLVPEEASFDFQERLQAISEEACDLWKKISRLRTNVELSFDVDEDDDLAWHELRLDPDRTTVAVRSSQSTDTFDKQLLSIFPRLCALDEDGETPYSHGVVLCESQVEVARKEHRERRAIKRTKTRRGSDNEGMARTGTGFSRKSGDFLDR